MIRQHNEPVEPVMYVSVRRYTVAPGIVDDVFTRARDEFVPIISKIPGFVSYCVVDAGHGVVASISTFEIRAAAEQSNREAADWVKERLADLFTGAPEITAGEVIVQAP